MGTSQTDNNHKYMKDRGSNYKYKNALLQVQKCINELGHCINGVDQQIVFHSNFQRFSIQHIEHKQIINLWGGV